MSGILDELVQQHAQYRAQRDQAQVNFQQLSGAIFAIEELIKTETAKIEEASKDAAVMDSCQGDDNGEAIIEEQVEAAQE